MKKNEKIKDLEAQLQESILINKKLQEELHSVYQSLECMTCPSPAPYFPKLSKTEAFDMVIRMLHTQPTSNPSLESVLTSAEEVLKWYNTEEPIPQPENKLEDWDYLLGKLAWKFTPSETGEMSADAFQVFSELQHEFLITRK